MPADRHHSIERRDELWLSGVGEVRLIDHDEVETSNLTRSPLFRADRLRTERKRWKASECARAVLDLSYATDPIVRFAVAYAEDLGPAAFVGCDVVIAAVDRLTVRARLADWTRLLGVPLVEVGFSAPRGQVSVYPNRAAAEPCWRCLHPHVLGGSASCALYARRVVAEGHVPATQALAATFGALASEAAILAVHGEFPLGSHLFALDIRRGVSRNLEITTDPSCPGVHHQLGEIRRLPVKSTAPLHALFEAVHTELEEPVLHLPEAFLHLAPCHRCGRTVPVGKPARLVPEPPSCTGVCELDAATSHGRLAAPVVVTEIARGHELARWKAQRFGLRPGAIVTLSDRATSKQLVVAFEGGPDDLFVTRRRSATPAENPQGNGFCEVPGEVQAARDEGFAAIT